MKPKFKPIPGYDGKYLISSCGKVYSHKHKKFLKPQLKRNGYLGVILCKGSKTKHFMVHRLVAKAFCELSNGATEVNHKDGDKKNNHFTNLEWVTSSENRKHALWILGNIPFGDKNKRSKRVAQVCIESNKTVAVFPSTWEAARKTGLHQTSIARAARGELKATGGFRWRYV
jgi:hypothetical protein